MTKENEMDIAGMEDKIRAALSLMDMAMTNAEAVRLLKEVLEDLNNASFENESRD